MPGFCHGLLRIKNVVQGRGRSAANGCRAKRVFRKRHRRSIRPAMHKFLAGCARAGSPLASTSRVPPHFMQRGSRRFRPNRFATAPSCSCIVPTGGIRSAFNRPRVMSRRSMMPRSLVRMIACDSRAFFSRSASSISESQADSYPAARSQRANPPSPASHQKCGSSTLIGSVLDSMYRGLPEGDIKAYISCARSQ